MTGDKRKGDRKRAKSKHVEPGNGRPLHKLISG